MPLDIHLGDVLELRKPHPCGSRQWQVFRLGADIGLRCLGCQRRVLLERRTLERRLKTMVSRSTRSLTVEGNRNKMTDGISSQEASN